MTDSAGCSRKRRRKMKGLPELVIGDLKVKRPVIQGGMGVGVSLGQLAGAVAKEGGVGIISTAQIGFREPDFETNTRAANIRAIGSEFQRAVSESFPLTSQPFFLPLNMPCRRE